MFWMGNKENSFLIRTLIWRHDKPAFLGKTGITGYPLDAHTYQVQYRKLLPPPFRKLNVSVWALSRGNLTLLHMNNKASAQADRHLCYSLSWLESIVHMVELAPSQISTSLIVSRRGSRKSRHRGGFSHKKSISERVVRASH